MVSDVAPGGDGLPSGEEEPRAMYSSSVLLDFLSGIVLEFFLIERPDLWLFMYGCYLLIYLNGI